MVGKDWLPYQVGWPARSSCQSLRLRPPAWSPGGPACASVASWPAAWSAGLAGCASAGGCRCQTCRRCPGGWGGGTVAGTGLPGCNYFRHLRMANEHARFPKKGRCNGRLSIDQWSIIIGDMLSISLAILNMERLAMALAILFLCWLFSLG